MNGYKIRYRGGPMAGRIEMVPDKPVSQTRLIRHLPKPRKMMRRVQGDPMMMGVYATMPKEKMGVYSQVYTPLKDGSILYVWVEQ